MPKMERINYDNELNFLKSEHIVAFTQTATDALATTVDGKRIVRAGTIFPANDATAIGIVFHDVDVTDGPEPASVIVEGHVYADRLPVAPAAAAIGALKNIAFH